MCVCLHVCGANVRTAAQAAEEQARRTRGDGAYYWWIIEVGLYHQAEPGRPHRIVVNAAQTYTDIYKHRMRHGTATIMFYDLCGGDVEKWRRPKLEVDMVTN